MSSNEAELPWEIDCKSVKEMLDTDCDFLLMDCRGQEEYNLVKIDQATLIPMDQLTSQVDQLEPYRDKRIVVHCHLGGRSMRVAQWLRQQGFTQSQSMAGGITAWADDIDPSLPKY
ncbi:MAG: rhodanese [Blastopirellula sp.]|nr:MAG: rhodanese [Blastopirellula sp.]